MRGWVRGGEKEVVVAVVEMRMAVWWVEWSWSGVRDALASVVEWMECSGVGYVCGGETHEAGEKW